MDIVGLASRHQSQRVCTSFRVQSQTAVSCIVILKTLQLVKLASGQAPHDDCSTTHTAGRRGRICELTR